MSEHMNYWYIVPGVALQVAALSIFSPRPKYVAAAVLMLVGAGLVLAGVGL